MDKVKVLSKFNVNLECLRGIAAIIVVISHIIYYHTYFNSTYFPATLNSFDPPAHLAVLLFFLLSGYVIGVSSSEKMASSDIFKYVKKRFVRIYPIYFLAVIIGLAVSTEHNHLRTIVSNFTLTQNTLDPVIFANNPIWSLNFEALYYLLFIPLAFFSVNTVYTFIASLLFGLLFFYIPGNPILSGYSFGYCFWLAGLYIARNHKFTHQDFKLLPMLFYILAIHNLIGWQNFVSAVLSVVKKPVAQPAMYWAQNIVGLEDLLFLPYCFFIFLFFAGLDFKYRKAMFLIMQILPLSAIALYFVHPTNDQHFLVGVVYYAIASVSVFINIPETYLRNLGSWLGSISYGIYIIHFPILIVFGRITYASGGMAFYILKAVLYLAVTILTAWILEKKLQPVFRSWFYPKVKLKVVTD